MSLTNATADTLAGRGVGAGPITSMMVPGDQQFSPDVFGIPLGEGRYLIYAPLHKVAFVANRAVVNRMAALREGGLDGQNDELTSFLAETGALDDDDLVCPLETFEGTPTPTSVSLFLTTACNLRCTYCYASAGDTPVRGMPLEVAQRGIRYVARNAVRLGKPSFGLVFHGGGEPTVNWSTLTGALDYAREFGAGLGLKVHASTATNGVLSDRRIDWMIANLQGASVSFDGLSHDRHRPMASGAPSSDRVMHTLTRFDEAGFAYGIRVTVTADQIEGMADSVEFILKNFSARRVQVEPAYQMGRYREAPAAETQEFIDGFRELQHRAAKLGKTVYFSGARADSLSNHFCGVTRDSFALSAEGNVSGCFEVFAESNDWSQLFFYGKPVGEDDYTFDLERLNHLRKQSVENRDFCRGCFAKWHCGGDCYHKSLHVNGSTEFAGSDRCHIIRELTLDQIFDRIAQSGGICWRGEKTVEGNQASGGKEMLL